MAWKLGIEGKLYFGSPGSSPSTELKNISGDLTLNLETVEANTSVRDIEFELTDVVRFKASIEWEMVADEEDAGYAAIWAAFVGRRKLAFKCLASDGGKGFDADFAITKLTPSQPKDGHQMASVTIKPAYSASHTPNFVS